MSEVRPRISKIDYPAHLAAMWQKAIAPRADDAPTVISTFAGGGGSSTGYMMAGFRELLAVEWDDNAVQTLRLNYPHLDIYHGDIAKLSVEEILQRTGLQPGQLDVFDGSPPCFPAGFQVLTLCGKIPIEFCTAGMSVLTHAGRFRKVSHMFERQYAGELYTVELKYGRKPITCTAEHQVYARQRIVKTRDNATRKNGTKYKAYTEPAWIAAKDLQIGDVLLEPHASGIPDLELPKVITKQRINMEGESGKELSEMRLLERDCQIDWKSAEMAWLLGFYLAEGHVRGHNPTLDANGACRREVIFSIADRETVDLVDKLNVAGFHAVAQKHSQGSSRVTVSDIDLWTLCQSVGKYADRKFIPVAFLCMPAEWQVEFLDGYFAGDGCITSSKRISSQKRKATTVSWGIATGIAKMIARAHGLVASIEVLYPAGLAKIQGRDVEVKEAYSVGYALPTSDRVRPGFVDEHGAWIPVKNITASGTDGTTVYNMEVEEDNSYTVEDVAVHNCQGFSTAGKRDFDDDRNQLFREYVRLLRGLQPKVFVMENVSGMVKGKMKLIFAEILRELKASGYRVSARLLNAMYFHVPQSRERMIFIGVREDLGIEPSHPKAESQPLTVHEAIGSLSGFMDAPRLSPLHTRYWNEAKQGEGLGNYNSSPKLNPNHASPTIRKDAGYGGLFHPYECRPINTRERQRLGSFPDLYRFTDWGSACNRIGNSVPPLLMEAIARHIRQEILSKI
jgi:DNA (cytosine-5)-methyltransferase 1